MELRVSKCSLVFSIFIISMFMPSYFSNSIFNIIENFAFLASLFILVKYKYKWNNVTVAITIYWLELMLMTFINGLSTVDYHFVISNLKIIACILFIDFMLQTHRKSAINILFYILLIYIVADFVSVLLFPDGLYFVAREWNQWSTTYSAQWILGNKNNRIFWYLMFLAISYCKFDLLKKKKSIYPAIFSACSVVVVILVQSSTATVALLIAGFGLIFSYYKRYKIKININHKVIFLTYFALSIIVLLGNIFTNQSGVLNSLSEYLFEKDISTVLARTDAWEGTIAQIIQSPLTGQGIISSSNAGNILGSIALTDAHNAILNILWQGGLIAFGLVIIVFWQISKQAKYVNNKNTSFLLSMLLIAILVETLFESVLSQNYGWYMMIILYNITLIYSNKTVCVRAKNQQEDLTWRRKEQCERGEDYVRE